MSFAIFLCQKALSDAGFVASNTEKYALGDVVDAVKNATDSTPKISCAKKGAVKELWICFDKNFEVFFVFITIISNKLLSSIKLFIVFGCCSHVIVTLPIHAPTLLSSQRMSLRV